MPENHLGAFARRVTYGDVVLPSLYLRAFTQPRPESFARWLEELKARARLVLPRGTGHFGGGFAWLPGRYHPRRAAEELRMARLMADFIRGLVADARRPVIVTGFSQGAILSYAVAALVPELVAAAVPVAGYLPERVEPVGSAKDHRKVSIRAIHGEKDPVLTLARARSSVERLRKSGFDVKLHEHPGVGHTITTEMAAELRATLQALLKK